MKKSQTKSKSSVKTLKLSAQKKAGTPLKAAEKTLKKPSRPKTGIKKGTGAKASALLPKGVAKKVKPTPASPGKAPFKKSVAGKTTKPSIETGRKKLPGSVKEAPAKLSKTQAKTKSAAVAPVSKTKKLPKAPAIKKTAASKSAVKKPEKPSEKITKTKKTAGKGTSKAISAAKSLTPAKKPAKKSPARTLAPAKVTKKKTVKPIGTKRPSAKVKKVAAGKPEGKTVKSLKVAAIAEGRAKTKKSIAKKQKPLPKKPLIAKTAPQIKAPAKQKATLKTIEKEKSVKTIKTAVSAEGSPKTKKDMAKGQKPLPEKKPLIAKTAPQIKAPAKQKAILKTIEKEGTLLSPGRKTVEKKGTSSLAAAGPLLDTGNKATAAHVAVSVVPSQTETRQKKPTRLKVFLPEEELPPEEIQGAPSPKLPEEFGENELLLMEVDPAIVFVSWEIKPDCISCKTGNLALRVYDVTGLEFDGSNANKFFDIALSKRVDSKFIDIRMPGRDVLMEIGLLQPDGSFEAIKRSNKVSMPALLTLEEFGIGSLFGPDTLIGY